MLVIGIVRSREAKTPKWGACPP